MLKKSWLYKFGIVVLLFLIRALLCNVPTAYAESGEEKAVSNISENNNMKDGSDTPTRMIYSPNTTANTKVDVYLGVTKDIVSWLKSHEKDNYYLGTKYVGTINTPNSCIKPKGEYGSASGMNCTGFVASVLKKNGADLAKLTQRLGGSYANACNWQDTVHKKNCRTYRFTSIKEMLASGKLEKGDIIYFEPDWQDVGDDCHIGFFWGNTSSDNKFWHSTAEHGNAITEIKSKSDYTYVYIFKTQKRGSLEITKISGDESITKNNTNYTLAGAVYKLYNSSGKVAAVLTTNKKGTAKVENLPTGTYTLKETTAPKGYKLDEKTYKITIKNGEKVSKKLKEKPEKGKVEIEKSSSDPSIDLTNDNYSLSGAVYKLYSGKQVIATLTTDKKGKASVSDIPIGTYVLKETKAPKGFDLDKKEYSVTIDGSVTKTIKVKDDPIKGTVHIYKSSTDSSATNGNSAYSLKGAVYKLYLGDKAITTLTTDENGKAIATSLPLGTYVLKEVTAPKGFYLDKKEYLVKVDGAAIKKVQVKDEPIRGEVQIYKSSSCSSVTNGNLQYSLNGAVYKLYKEKKVVATLTTDKNGYATAKNLPAGSYTLKEVTAPKGYLVDKTSYKITVKLGKITTKKIKETPRLYEINVSLLGKVDKDTNKKSAQGMATLKNAEFTVKYYDGIYSKSELEGKKAKRTWVLKTDNNGECKLDEKYKVSGNTFYYDSEGKIVIPKGTLTICETKAPKGYLLNEKVFVRYFGEKDTDKEVVAFQTIKVSEAVVKGNLQIKKYGANPDDVQKKYPLEGVVFEIKSKKTGKKVKIVTDKNGVASTESLGGLVYDTYEVKEIKTPKNYVQSSDSFEVVVKNNNELLSYEVINYEKRASVQIVKKDLESMNTILESGVKFKILDGNRQVLYEEVETDENGIARIPERLPIGEYYIEETKAPNGYLIGESKKFTVEKETKENNPIVVEVFNKPIKGKLTLEKVDSEDKAPLCGVKFHVIAAEDIKTKDGRVHAQNGEIVDVMITDQQGMASSKELYLGKYYVEEVETLKGYTLKTELLEANLECENQKEELIIKDLGEIENCKDPRPRIVQTNLSDANKQSYSLYADEKMYLCDSVECTNLKKGEMYILEGVLMDHETEKPLMINGEKIISQVKFTAEESDDTIMVEYNFDGSTLGGKKIVAFETLICADGMADEHCDLEDKNQTVQFSAITTSAYDGKTKKKIGMLEKDICLKDVVCYYNLVPGEQYIIKGIVMDKVTGKELVIDGKRIETEKQFVATGENGAVLVEFKFDGSLIKEQEVVVFEYLYSNDGLIAKHDDLLDEKQMVMYKLQELEKPEEPVEDEEPEEPIEEGEPEEPIEEEEPEKPEDEENPEEPIEEENSEKPEDDEQEEIIEEEEKKEPLDEDEPEYPVKDEEPKEVEKRTESEIPLTEDNQNLMFFVLCATISCAILIKRARMTRKNR